MGQSSKILLGKAKDEASLSFVMSSIMVLFNSRVGVGMAIK